MIRSIGLIEKFGVKLVCTTDDPIDDLEYHKQIAAQNNSFKVYPAWRPDKLLNIDRAGFVDYMNTLSRVSGVNCLNIESVLKALEIRLDYFHANGARVSDHALDTVPYAKTDAAKADAALKKGLAGEALTQLEVDEYKTYLLVKLGGMYKARGWVQQ